MTAADQIAACVAANASQAAVYLAEAEELEAQAWDKRAAASYQIGQVEQMFKHDGYARACRERAANYRTNSQATPTCSGPMPHSSRDVQQCALHALGAGHSNSEVRA